MSHTWNLKPYYHAEVPFIKDIPHVGFWETKWLFWTRINHLTSNHILWSEASHPASFCRQKINISQKQDIRKSDRLENATNLISNSHNILKFNSFIHDGGPYRIETSPLVGISNQWTGFYMIETSVMKELMQTICTEKMTFLRSVYSEASQRSKMELFAKMNNSFQLLTLFTKSSILDVGLGSKYISFPFSFKIYSVASFFLPW